MWWNMFTADFAVFNLLVCSLFTIHSMQHISGHAGLSHKRECLFKAQLETRRTNCDRFTTGIVGKTACEISSSYIIYTTNSGQRAAGGRGESHAKSSCRSKCRSRALFEFQSLYIWDEWKTYIYPRNISTSIKTINTNELFWAIMRTNIINN